MRAFSAFKRNPFDSTIAIIPVGTMALKGFVERSFVPRAGSLVRYDDRVRSSAYLEYRSPFPLANFNIWVSRREQIMLLTTGDVGAPWGSSFLRQHICARTVAASI